MPSHSNPSSRRNASSVAARTSRPASGARASRAADSSGAPQNSAPKAGDVGAKRRALKKKRSRQGNLVAWTIAGAITVAIAGAGVGIWSEFEGVKGRVAQKRATLADLSAQLESGKRRLRALASASGKERVLVENGFIKSGERLLLFPKSDAPKRTERN